MKYAVCLWLLLLTVCCQHQDPASGSNEDEEKAMQWLEQGAELNSRERYDSARHILNNALALNDVSDSIRGYINAELAAGYVLCGDMKQAVDHSLKALALCRNNVDDATFVIMAGNAGIAYRRLGMNDSAAVCYQQGVEVGLRANDDAGLAYLYNNLSVLYCEMERLDEALGYARQARHHAKLAGDTLEYYSAMANEGVTCSKKGEHKQAALLLEETFEQAEHMNSTPLKLKVANHLITTLNQLGDAAAVDRYLAKAEEMTANFPPHSIAVAGILEAKMNVEFSRGNYRSALLTAGRLEQMPELLAIPLYKLRRIQASCHAALGDAATAYRLEQAAAAIEDSVSGREVEKLLSEYSVRFKTVEKELLIKTLQQEKSAQQLRYAVVIVVLLIVISLLAIVVLWNRQRRKILRKQTEIDMARKYIAGIEEERARQARELHDGACNDLLALGLGIRANTLDRESLLARLEEMRAELRLISHKLMPPSFVYASLNDILGDYLASLVKPDTLAINFSQQGDGWERIPHDTAYQLYRIAQEAVSNCIRHADATAVEVSISADAQSVTLRVADNGRPIAPVTADAASTPADGAGLRSMRDRAAAINATFNIISGDSGTTVEVRAAMPAPAAD